MIEEEAVGASNFQESSAPGMSEKVSVPSVEYLSEYLAVLAEYLFVAAIANITILLVRPSIHGCHGFF